MIRLILLIFLGTVYSLAANSNTPHPIPFVEATIQQVVNDVSIIEAEDLVKQPASIHQTFRAPDILETGRRSRAELVAEDGTITRVGSNTLFSFEPTKREIKLERGSVLFHSPSGRGGGQIVTNAATAAVVGTTIIVAATSDGGFKILCLEGRARIRFKNGTETFLEAGQLTFVLPKTTTAGNSSSDAPGTADPDGEAGPVLNFDLDKMSTQSGLVTGFESDLPSMDKIIIETTQQKEKIENGDFTETEAVIIGSTGSDEIVLVDASIVEKALEISKQQEGSGSNQSNLVQALESDISLSQTGVIPSINLLTSPTNISASQSAYLGAPSPFGNSFSGLVANNIVIEGDYFDLSPLSQNGSSRIDVAAASSILILTDLFAFLGNDTIDSFRLTTPMMDFVKPNADATNAGHVSIGLVATKQTAFLLDFLGDSPFDIDDSSIYNTFGPIEFHVRQGGLNLRYVDFTTSNTGSNSFIGYTLPNNLSNNLSTSDARLAPADIAITAPGDITIDTSFFTAATSRVRIGELEAQGAPTPESILMQNSYITSVGLKLIANKVINLNNNTFNGVTDIRMSAGTINLENTTFPSGSLVELSSNMGIINNTGSKLTGYVNFINNVMYGSDAAELHVNPSLLVNPPSSTTLSNNIKVFKR